MKIEVEIVARIDGVDFLDEMGLWLCAKAERVRERVTRAMAIFM